MRYERDNLADKCISSVKVDVQWLYSRYSPYPLRWLGANNDSQFEYDRNHYREAPGLRDDDDRTWEGAKVMMSNEEFAAGTLPFWREIT